MNEQFEMWCEKQWTVISDWGRIPCSVHVSPACLDQVRVAYADSGGVDFIGIAARYYDELTSQYWTGQVQHALAEPLQNTWYVLLYLGHIYIDVQEHPLATKERRVIAEPE